MVELQLTTWERLAIKIALSEVEGNVGVMRAALKALDAVDFTAEEIQTLGLQQTDQGLQWQDNGATTTVTLDTDIVKRVIQERTRRHWQICRLHGEHCRLSIDVCLAAALGRCYETCELVFRGSTLARGWCSKNCSAIGIVNQI